ncbi:MAG: Crp/Fnr family transcriptional regulator [Acidimicrobiia bacterium]|nr:Crp/Fnr family transcriptional regulator [Acidimicrobiia bacterium]
MTVPHNQHLAWLARSFGRSDYLPLSSADLEVISSVSVTMSRYPASHLFREGGQAVAAYLIESGEVDLYRTSAGRKRVVARVGSGSVIGDIAMFGEGTYQSSAQAVDHVRAFRFDRAQLIPELAKHPAICLRWLVSGLQQLERAQSRIIHLMHKTVVAQVADLLVEEACDKKEIQLSQAAIGTLLGASRQTVNEALSSLRRINAIETGYRVIRVTDTDALTRVAERGTI